MTHEQAGNGYLEESFQAYQELTATYGASSPQHQGLTQEEYGAAINDPLVATTMVEIDGKQQPIPQLAPVERNEWLNADFYAKTFPEEYATGNVLQYVDIPGVTPGEQVTSRLRDLAAEEGIVVFDYPTTDPEYPTRVQALLAEQGITAGPVQELGNQTYFIGKTHLDRIEDPLPAPKPLGEAFDELVAAGELDPNEQNGATLKHTIDAEEADRMLGFYDEAYQVLNDHPCKQGLSPEEFHEMIVDRPEVDKLVNVVSGTAVALCILDNNLEGLSWVNDDYYKQHYAEASESGQLLWFPGLAADPNSEVGNNTQSMVNLIAKLAERANNDIVIAFDCCDMNTGFLDKFLESMINETPEASVQIETIAVQRYCAIKTSL